MNEKPLTVCKNHNLLRTRMGDGRPVCRECRRIRLDTWQKNPANKEKLARWGKDWRDKNGARAKYLVRRSYLKKTYGLDHETFDALAAKQGNACAICQVPSSAGRYLHIDHNHSTGRIRGLLCGSCNRAIGLFKDNPTVLRLAAAYLELLQT